MMTLPIVVDWRSSKVANQMLVSDGPDRFGSSNTTMYMQLRKRRSLSQNEANLLTLYYCQVLTMVQFGDPRQFTAMVPREGLEAWFEHCIECFRQLAANKDWVKKGKLQQYDECLLTIQVHFLKHSVPLSMEDETDSLFASLAFFVGSCKLIRAPSRKLPVCEAAQQVTLLVDSLVDRSFADGAKKMFRRLEATGLLKEYLRCASILHLAGVIQAGLPETMARLIEQTVLLKKKFRIGMPCGDVATNITNGPKQHPPFLVNYLRSVLELARLQQDFCNTCNAPAPLECGRCKVACYCSEECQRADWEGHKEFCLPIPQHVEENRVSAPATQNVLRRFISEHYSSIMYQLVEECNKTGMGKDDLALELDFTAGPDGRVPALEGLPQCAFFPIWTYRDGSRAREAGWVRKRASRIRGVSDEQIAQLERSMIPKFVDMVNDLELTPDVLLCVALFPGQTVPFPNLLAQ